MKKTAVVGMKFASGDHIEWSSQSAGTIVTKRGEVLTVLAPSHRIEDALAELGRKWIASQFKAASVSGNPRYLVEVVTDGKPRYYAPLCKVIDGDSASAGRMVGAPKARAVRGRR